MQFSVLPFGRCIRISRAPGSRCVSKRRGGGESKFRGSTDPPGSTKWIRVDPIRARKEHLQVPKGP